MNWKIWEKKPMVEETAQSSKAEKLPKPKEMPEPVGRHLVVKLNKDPDWVWNLKVVLRPRADSKTTVDVRVFDETQAGSSGLHVRDYLSLDSHPHLILYEGWFDKQTGNIDIKEKVLETPRAA